MWTVGKIAEMVSITADAVRFYEREGLIAPERRSAGGYRLYGESALRRIRFIKRAQQSGFTMGEIRGLLSLRRSPNACCEDVRARAIEKKLQLEAKIRELMAMSKSLDALIARCAADHSPVEQCEILCALEAAATAKADA